MGLFSTLAELVLEIVKLKRDILATSARKELLDLFDSYEKDKERIQAEVDRLRSEHNASSDATADRLLSDYARRSSLRKRIVSGLPLPEDWDSIYTDERREVGESSNIGIERQNNT